MLDRCGDCPADRLDDCVGAVAVELNQRYRSANPRQRGDPGTAQLECRRTVSEHVRDDCNDEPHEQRTRDGALVAVEQRLLRRLRQRLM